MAKDRFTVVRDDFPTGRQHWNIYDRETSDITRFQSGPPGWDRYKTQQAAQKVADKLNRSVGKKGTVMTRRTNPRSNPRAASRWGVYVKGNLAYVSNSKLDANKAASKLRLSGRTHITQKPVGPNPISGKVPVIGWRAEYKKAAYSAIKSPRVRRARARTTGKIRRTRERRGENPATGKYAVGYNKERKFLKKSDAKKYIKSLGVKVMPIFTYDRRTGNWNLFEYYGSDYYKRNPQPRRTVAGPSARAVAGRIGRSVGARVVNPRYRGRDAGIGTRSVAKGGRLRNAAFTHVPYSRIKKGETFVGGSLWEKLIKVSATKALTEYGEYVTLSANQIVGKLKRSNPRRHNAASVLRRRTNPTYVIWKGNAKSGYRVAAYSGTRAAMAKVQEALHKQGTSTFVIPLSSAKKAEAQQRKGATLKGGPGGLLWRKNPRTTRRASNPRKGYVVQVGNSVAWVGKLATDAQKAMKKLLAAGHKAVEGFEAKLPAGFKRGWRKQYAKVARKGNPSFGRGKLGSGSRFKKCVSTMKRRKGVYDPAGLCASIGRRKYGAKRMVGMARKGMRRRSNPPKFYRIAYTMPSGKRHVGLISANDLADATQYYKRVMLREFPDGRGGTKASRLTIRRARGTEIPKQYR